MMDKTKAKGHQEELNNAAEDSVKDAVKRGRVRRAGRPSVQNGEVRLDNPARSGGEKQVVPMDQKQFVPYLKRKKTSLIPNDEHGEDEDSNDEWEEKVELDPKVMEAAVASLKDSPGTDAPTQKQEAKKKKPSRNDDDNNDLSGTKKSSEEDAKARKRLQAAAKRKKFVLRHSIHIVLSIATSIRLDAAANDDQVRGLALSITPADTFLADTNFMESLSRFGLWLRAVFKTTVLIGKQGSEYDALSIRRFCSASKRAIEIVKKKRGDILDLLVVVATIVRAQGFRCRIVSPLQLVSHKASSNTRTENNETGLKQVVETEPTGLQDFVLYGWVEIWAVSLKRWIPLDVFSGQVCALDPSESITSSIERIPAFKPEQQDSEDTETATTTRSSKLKRKLRDLKPKQEKKRKRPNESPSPSLRSVNGNMFFHVVAVENGRVTDVTRRYTQSWKAIEKARAKGRLFEKAIENISIEDAASAQDDAHRLELQEFDRIAAADEIPTSVTAIQRHPRYVLERHLKKYEIIYPKEPIIGYIKEEPIFLRANVQLLHTKDRWIRQMREVIEGVNPLKSVRSMNGTDAKVELYGSWQTNPLIIPPCVDGKVPRGVHGNVDIWTLAHIPSGAEHVNMPYAKIAARKLGVDFAPAMTGFDVRGGRSVPRIEGVVVASESADIVRDGAKASAHAAAERKEKRAREEALRRWHQLLRAVHARQKVKRRYGSCGESGTYEAAQKREGLKKAREEKRNTQTGRAAPQELTGGPSLQTSKYDGPSTHTHEFVETEHRQGDTVVRVCKGCKLEMAFEVL